MHIDNYYFTSFQRQPATYHLYLLSCHDIVMFLTMTTVLENGYSYC